DNGTTTVITRTFDLSGYLYPVIEYYRWFSNDRGGNGRSDAWQVQIRDTLSPLWKTVEFTYQSEYAWRRRVLSVWEMLPTTRFVQLRFIAKDAVVSNLGNNGQNCIEAALDDFAIY